MRILRRRHRAGTPHDRPGVAGRSARPGTPAVGLSALRRPGQADHLLGPARPGRGKAGLLARIGIFHGQLGPGRPRTSRRRHCAERLGGSRRAIKVALWTSTPWPASATFMPRKSCTAPAFTPPALPPASPGGLAQAARRHGRNLAAAIRHQGSTLRDGTYRIAHNRPGDYQIFHRVYGRAGELCLQCGADRIVRIVQAQRSTFFCPTCQRPCSSRRRR